MHGTQGKINATLFPFTAALRWRLAVPTLKPYLPRPSADKIRCHRRSGRTTLAPKLHSTIEEKYVRGFKQRNNVFMRNDMEF